MSAAQDQMAEAYRTDSRAEQAFRQMARDITALLNAHESELGGRDIEKLMGARGALTRRADHIVAVWD